MRKGRPSLTAHVMAAVRAGLTNQGLLADNYAWIFARPPIRLLARLVRTPLRNLPLLREMVGNVAGRTLLFDRQLSQALESGIAQVVILGAGYDSRSYRFSRSDTQFVEVDIAETQVAKVRRLERSGIDVSDVSFLAVDFETESLHERLGELLDATRPTFFVWEGVVEYLPEDAVRQTLRDLSRVAGPKSQLVFDLPHASSECSKIVDFASRSLSRLLGEPKGVAMEPDTLEQLLRDEGWRTAAVFEITQLHDEYFSKVVYRAPTPHNYYVLAVPI